MKTMESESTEMTIVAQDNPQEKITVFNEEKHYSLSLM